MKKRDLESFLRSLGYEPIGGTKHDKWSNGHHTTMVPRKNEINELTAKGIIKACETARANRLALEAKKETK